MKKQNYLGVFAASAVTLSQAVFAAGTFHCVGTGVKLDGVYGSIVGRADLKSIKWNSVVDLSEQDLSGQSSAYQTSSKLLASAIVDNKRIQLDAEGASEDGAGEPIVYGGVLKVTTWQEDVKGNKSTESTKSVAVTCSASY